jgi:hypothetical protein
LASEKRIEEGIILRVSGEMTAKSIRDEMIWSSYANLD